ncbi:MAG: ATP-binding cassette domain-containing protein, partial [Bacteroidota bacterium]|nr:ATP-binding cassette domain-containing protein [Candidatus Kapabacteria bacterium]MDW8220915.1 ATP-binding cassette domain-containing protein [Bacteroidota bacterium]
PPVADYLYAQFERYIETGAEVESAARQIREGFSYENRVFILMKVYELASADQMEEAERETARAIGQEIGVSIEDLAFIEKIYDVPEAASIETTKPTIIQSLRVGDIPGYSDIVLPYQRLDLEIMKIGNIYVALLKSPGHPVSIGSATTMTKNLGVRLANKIQHNQNITIHDYTINYEDLNFYFQLKTKFVVPLTLYVAKGMSLEGQEEFIISRMSSYEDIMTIEFNRLTIVLRPLTPLTNLTVNGIPIDEQIYVNLNDDISIDNCPINLRKIAFQEGLANDTFPLEPDKYQYKIGNHKHCDVIIPDDASQSWDFRIVRLPYATGQHVLQLEPKGCPYTLFHNSRILRKPTPIPERSIILIDKYVVNLNFSSGVASVEPFRFKDFVARQISYQFQDGTQGLDEVSFEIDYGDLVAIMGPSGCGKSTLLNVLNGYNKPNSGTVELNSYNLHKLYPSLRDHLGYVPQDDLLFENLTVYENLYYNAKLRYPRKSEKEINELVERVLVDIDLADKRDIRAGSPTQRTLSGGQRKRLNIGLELLSGADVYFLDEPTSGLSSKDSEKIIELLRRISLQGKIVFVVIHQPSSKIYKMFDKTLFLDKGGKMVFYGDSMMALAYFKAHSELFQGEAVFNNKFDVVTVAAQRPFVEQTEPDLLLAVLEEPLRDIDGVPLPQRKYSPDYWKERFAEYRNSVKRLTVEDANRIPLPPPREYTFGDKWRQFVTLLSRNFKNKFRDRSNLLITFLEAPLLALTVALILRLLPNATTEYNLFQNDNLRIYIFLATIISMFLAMTNSVDEIIKDAAILLRERMLNIRNTTYYASKFITLFVFCSVQNALFLAASFPILELRELYFEYLGFLTIVSFNGIAIGLFISAIPNISSKAAFNIVPLVLIPQIIFAGALIPYSQMDHLKINHKRDIPEICQFIPSRWAYEGLVSLQYSFNSYQPKADILQRKLMRGIVLSDMIDALEKERDSLTSAYEAQYAADTAARAAKIAELDQQIAQNQAKLAEMQRSKSTLDSAIEANRLLIKKNIGNPEILKKYIQDLQEAAQTMLSFYAEFDKPALERSRIIAYYDNKLKTDSLRYAERIAALNEQIQKIEFDLQDFQVIKQRIDSLLDRHRAEFQQHYGNQEIARLVRNANDMYHDLKVAAYKGLPHGSAEAAAHAEATRGLDIDIEISWWDYPMLVSTKYVPFLHTVNPWFKTVPTAIYDAVVLWYMAVVASFVTILMLATRDRMVQFFQRFRRKKYIAVAST